jgi:hypothetical protein
VDATLLAVLLVGAEAVFCL